MLISTTSIRRPVLAAVANILLVVLGILAFQRLPVRQYPDIDPPVLSITTTYLGASAAVVESDVTKRIEEAVAGVEGVRLITASSRDEVSQIDIEFRIGRQIDFAAADVRDQIARIRKTLPTTVDDPVVSKQSGSAQPIMWLSLTSDSRDPLELTDYARRNLVDQLSVVPGVARVFMGGERRYAIRVWLDPDALAAKNLTADDVVRRLQQENVELPAGRLESANRELTVRTTTRLPDPTAFADLIVRETPAGQIRLGQVAKVELGAENYRTGVWIDGKPAVGLGVVRQSTANVLDVADGVKAALERLRPSIPKDIEISNPYDESVFIKASIYEVNHALVIALILVVLVILGFLSSFRATLIPTLAIPVSLIAAMMVMSLAGFSINVLTLLAFVLAIGLVVDDAIVVLENIHRRMELGEPKLLAAVNGAKEVYFAVIATTVVLVAVFVPLAFLQGNTGRLFTEFGVTLAAAVAFSGITALSLSPMLCSLILRHDAKPNFFARGTNWFFARLSAGYKRTLDVGLSVGTGALVALSLLVLGGAVGGSWWLLRGMPSETAPVEDRGFLIVPMEAPQGSTMQYTLDRVDEVERVLEPLRGADGPIERVLVVIGLGAAANAPVNQAFVIVRLKDWSQRHVHSKQLAGMLMPRVLGAIGGVSGAQAFIVNPPSLGQSGFSQPLQVAIGAENYEDAKQWSAQVVAALRAEPRIQNLRDDVDTTRPMLEVAVDRARAAEVGVSAADIGSALQVLLGAVKTTKYEERGQQYEVMVQAAAETRLTPTDLAAIHVRSASGRLVPLSGLVTWREIGADKELKRVDRRPAATITGTPVAGYSIGEAVARFETAAKDQLPPQAAISYLGQSREFKESAGGMVFIFALALFIVYLVLAAQFESLIHPFIIMTSAPLAALGALIALRLMDMSWNIYAQIGVVMLIGLMAKNGILMVEFANQLREEGRSIRDAIEEASAIRLRPILMTSIATVAGAVPLATAHGAGAEGRMAIGLVIIGGVTLATALTLYLVPALYLVLAGFTTPANARAKEIEREARERHAHVDGENEQGGILG